MLFLNYFDKLIFDKKTKLLYIELRKNKFSHSKANKECIKYQKILNTKPKLYKWIKNYNFENDGIEKEFIKDINKIVYNAFNKKHLKRKLNENNKQKKLQKWIK